MLSIGACRAVWVPGQAIAKTIVFDGELRKPYFVAALYAIRTSVHAYAIMLVTMCLCIRSL